MRAFDIPNGYREVDFSFFRFQRRDPESSSRSSVARLLWNPTFKAIFSGHVGGLLPHVAAEAVVVAYLIFSRTRHARWIGFKETLGLQSIKHVLTLSLLDFLLSFFGILVLLFQNQVNDVWCALVPTRVCRKAFSCSYLIHSSSQPLVRSIRDSNSQRCCFCCGICSSEQLYPEGQCSRLMSRGTGGCFRNWKVNIIIKSMYAWISAFATQQIQGRQAHQLNHLHTTFYS